MSKKIVQGLGEIASAHNEVRPVRLANYREMVADGEDDNIAAEAHGHALEVVAAAARRPRHPALVDQVIDAENLPDGDPSGREQLLESL